MLSRALPSVAAAATLFSHVSVTVAQLQSTSGLLVEEVEDEICRGNGGGLFFPAFADEDDWPDSLRFVL